MKISLLAVSLLVLAGCSSGEHSHDGHDEPHRHTTEAVSAATFDLMKRFDEASLVTPITEVDCILSGGTKSRCLSITLKPEPAFFKIGPWCPRHINDGPDVSGIWLESGRVYDVDGDFIQNLPEFYKDKSWQLFDPETGQINVTDDQVSCAAAARPDVDPQYQNHCVECQVSYMDEGVSQTYVIPISPVDTKAQSSGVARSGVGVAFSGARFDGSAPTDAILSAHTLAPFDDCGGHVNLHVGYHLHAVTDKEGCHKEVTSADGHAPQIGLAMDGYPLHARLNSAGDTAEGLDMCLGHKSEGHGYHYHANEPGANAILTCHKGETGCAQGSSEDLCDASQSTSRRGPPPGDRPAGPRPDR